MRQLTIVIVLMLFPVYLGAASVFSGALAEDNLHTFSDTDIDGLNIAFSSTFSFDNELFTKEGVTYSALFKSDFYGSLGYRVSPFLSFSLGLPVFGDRLRSEKESFSAFKPGDLESTIKLTIWGDSPQKQAVIPGIILVTTFPTGSEYSSLFSRYWGYTGNPLHAYTQESVVFNPNMTLNFDFRNFSQNAQLLYNLTLGGRFSTGENTKNKVVLSTGFKWLINEKMNFYTTFMTMADGKLSDGYFTLGEFPSKMKSGFEVITEQNSILGFHCAWGMGKKNFSYSSGADFQVKNAKMNSAPNFEMGISYAWRGIGKRKPQAPVDIDADDDGIVDSLDKCPTEAEDKDGFEDLDGCPDLDNDKDGILDVSDKCPLKAEDKDGLKDDDGCPEDDIDGDKILDSLDKCPEIAEDIDNFQDNDGCPELDNDIDGILDSLDKCPSKAEDFDGFKDDDGCPEEDNDGDGIVDILDKCPNQKETGKSGKLDGCPNVNSNPWVKTKGDTVEVSVLHGVTFASGSTKMTGQSYMYIEPLLNKLKKYEKFSIAINGYTDSAGSYEGNLSISRKRAESVKKFLVDNGINEERIKVYGFGPNKPIADNRTASGRAKNRRIEVVVTK